MKIVCMSIKLHVVNLRFSYQDKGFDSRGRYIKEINEFGSRERRCNSFLVYPEFLSKIRGAERKTWLPFIVVVIQFFISDLKKEIQISTLITNITKLIPPTESILSVSFYESYKINFLSTLIIIFHTQKKRDLSTKLGRANLAFSKNP